MEKEKKSTSKSKSPKKQETLQQSQVLQVPQSQTTNQTSSSAIDQDRSTPQETVCLESSTAKTPNRKGKTAKATEEESFSQLGRTIQRLRQAYNLTLSQLSDQSGVAKSIISQIERNETNPTLSTIWRLSQALNITIEEVLSKEEELPLIQHQKEQDQPVLKSEDGLCTLKIIGWINTVDWVQWYDVQMLPGGVIESDPHQRGAVENITVLSGDVEVFINQKSIGTVSTGETLRYRGDFPHQIKNIGQQEARLTMVNILKRTVME
jgi:transcriptional regulator with XRE-family HTH domain